MTFFIGVDPDLHTPSVACVDFRGAVVGLWVGRVIKELKGADAVIASAKAITEHLRVATYGAQVAAIEGQDLYLGGDRATKNPKSILAVAQVAGAAVGVMSYRCRVLLPLPRDWKGSVPKGIHQARICQRLGWPYRAAGGKEGYCVPTDPPVKFEKFKGGDWKHLLDAIGLAQWAAKQ